MSAAAATTQPQNSAAVNHTLQLELAALAPSGVERTIVPVVGKCPTDEPAWPGYTVCEVDKRQIQPHCVRYASGSQRLRSIHAHHDRIAYAIRDQVRKILLALNAHFVMPTILFDGQPHGQQGGCIDLVFPSSGAAISILNGMHSIKLDNEAPFNFMAWTNSLAGDTIPIDCLRLPLQTANTTALLKSLDHAVGEIGSVIGIGSFKITTPIESLASGDEFRTRSYLKLSRASMKLSFSELYTSLPTHFVWYGTPYRLYYPGSGLRNDVQYSADYPLEEDEATTSNDNTHSGSNTASPGSSSSTAIEVKEEKEEGGSRKRSRKG